MVGKGSENRRNDGIRVVKLDTTVASEMLCVPGSGRTEAGSAACGYAADGDGRGADAFHSDKTDIGFGRAHATKSRCARSVVTLIGARGGEMSGFLPWDGGMRVARWRHPVKGTTVCDEGV
ncbi:hypothetical protein GCM10022224_019850 [Nonomuraea antimicrobica]|uniref:Uncharacterized protein n=1 Tax=Nonomuraea antimicrobica TaxID=561173 RepID=A0ABP7BCS0_9ACTN